MTLTGNFPGPYEIRISYQDSGISPVLEHQQRLNVALVEPAAQSDLFSNYNFIDVDGVNTNTLDVLVEDFLTVELALFKSTTSVISVELWKYPTPQSFDAVFWSVYVPTANVGTSGSSPVPAGQAIFTFRSQEGGTLKINLMESIISTGPPRTYIASTTAEKALADFIISGDGATYSAPFLARDTSYPIAFNRVFPGQSEALFKKRNRP